MLTKSRFLSAVFLLMLFSPAFAKTITVPSQANNTDIQPAIQAAVDTALNGDMIVLPAGTFILNKSVVVTKFISIKGQGLTQTILYRAASVPDNTLSYDANWVGMFRYTINSTTSSHITISDIYFKSKQPSLVDGDGLSKAADIGIKMINCVDFVITRCRFDYFGNGAVSVYHLDTKAQGLIFKNEFHHNVKGADGLGLGYGVVVYGSNQQWVSTPKFGTSNFIFVEDNLFDYHRHSIAAGGGALYVFRYNTVNNNVAANTAHAIDGHGAQLSGVDNYYSTRAIEVYKNRIINTTFKDDRGVPPNPPNGTPITPGQSISWLVEACIRPRGGEALVHHNYIKGYRFGVGPVAEGPLDPTYPDRYQTGYASGVTYGASHTGVSGTRGAGDLFAWADTFDIYAPGDPNNVYFYNYSPSNLVAERDYHLYAKGGYAPYTYPHPLRVYAPPPPGGSPIVVEEESLSKPTTLDIFPNPSNGVFSLNFNIVKKDNYTLIVSDASGRIVQQKKLNAFQGTFSTSVDLANQGKGVYFVSLSGGGNTLTRKILVR